VVCGVPSGVGAGVPCRGGGRGDLVGLCGPCGAVAILAPGVPLVMMWQAARLKKRSVIVQPPLRSS
jgi:hypothetical protein